MGGSYCVTPKSESFSDIYSLYTVGNAHATDYYIARGDPSGEEYSPTFTQHGFRYAELSGLPVAPLPLEAAVALSSHNDVVQGSALGTSAPVLAKVRTSPRESSSELRVTEPRPNR